MRGSTKEQDIVLCLLLKSQHPRTSGMLASLYYMSNYATKDAVKLYQLVMTAAILKASLKKAAVEEEDLTAEQRRLLEM